MENSMLVFISLLVVGGLGYFFLAKGLFVGWSKIQEKISCAGSAMTIVFWTSVIALFMTQSMKVFFAPIVTYLILFGATLVLTHGKKLFGRNKGAAIAKGDSTGFSPVANTEQEVEREVPSSLPPPVQSQASGGFFNPTELDAHKTGGSEESSSVTNHKQEERGASHSLPPPVQSQASSGFFNPPEGESPFR